LKGLQGGEAGGRELAGGTGDRPGDRPPPRGLHGGSLSVRSDGVGTGSEFVVRLP